MKREALIRKPRRFANERGMFFDLDRGGGKGSHHRVRLGDRTSTIQSGELSPFQVNRICKQLDVDSGAL